MLRVLRALSGVTTFLVAAAGCSFPPAFRHETAPIERSIAFEGCRQFETKLSNGTIKIQGWKSANRVHLGQGLGPSLLRPIG